MKVGDTVALKRHVRDHWSVPDGREDNETARIEVLLSDIEGGVKTDRDLHGCRYWNVDDLDAVCKSGEYVLHC